MLMGLPPLGSPLDWGMPIDEALYINGYNIDELTGRFVSVVINKATYTAVIISISEGHAKVYLNEPRELILDKPIHHCHMVTVHGKSRADRATMKRIEEIMREASRKEKS